MKTSLDCIPCFINQGLSAARFISNDLEVQEQIVRAVLEATAKMNLFDTPPAMGQIIHRIIRSRSGNSDPYREIKARSNQIMLERLPGFRKLLREGADSFESAIRLAIAGNIIDYGAGSDIKEEHIHQAINQAFHTPLKRAAIDRFRNAVENSESILFIADNAGEIILDRLLIEQFTKQKVILAVRGMPVINDVTYNDAEAAGLTEMVEVVDNGSDAPGTILKDCSAHFRRLFYDMDLIVAKGQGNYETISEEPGNIFFLLKAKCPVIAGDLGCEIGEFVILENIRHAESKGAFS